MKDIKQTPSWSNVVIARGAWERASPRNKEAAAKIYASAVRKCMDERDTLGQVSTAPLLRRRPR